MAAIQVKSLNCPGCGGPVELRGFANTLTVVCTHCLCVLDASTAEVRILQKAQTKQKVQPLIPLGSRGKLHGVEYEVIGFEVQGTDADGEHFEWREYVLFNPYKGFRYLSEYQGHWNDIAPLKCLPTPTLPGTKYGCFVQGQRFNHFQTASARTMFVLGEFPWRVRTGDTAEVVDYVAPPRVLSSEKYGGAEVTWSLGEYVAGDQLWQAFRLPGRAPAPVGIYENQPSPYGGKVGSVWRMFLWMLVALCAVAFFFTVSARRDEVLQKTYFYKQKPTGEASFVTDVFELKGRSSNVEITIHTDVNNSWVYFNFALIEDSTGHAYDFGREVSYYYGSDSDGSWSEGGVHDEVLVPSVPAGRYYLRVEPEMQQNSPGVSYTLTVRRDVPSYGFFFWAAFLLLIPPLAVTWRAFGFERRRWQDSDHPMVKTTGGDD